MDQAIGWARTAGMKVLVDCHGSPGSQNGQDHSGRAGDVAWQTGDNLNQSTTIMVTIAEKYGSATYADVVMGIETVNEPTANAPNVFATTKQWAADTWTAMQAVIENKDLQIYTHDSFQGITQFLEVAQGLGATTFGVDQHDYQLYTDSDNALDQPGHIAKACGWGADLATCKAGMSVIVGEWSAASNICVDTNDVTSSGTSCSGDGCQCTSADTTTWNTNLIEQARRYVEAQLDTYEANANAYFVWSYKAGGAWGPENLIANGVWPQPMSDRKYPGQCS